MVFPSPPRLSGPLAALAIALTAAPGMVHELAAASRRGESTPAAPAITMTEALPVLLQRGVEAFAASDYATAAAAFAQVERDYGAEPEWQNGRLPHRLLPLRGFAELRAGQAGDAA